MSRVISDKRNDTTQRRITKHFNTLKKTGLQKKDTHTFLAAYTCSNKHFAIDMKSIWQEKRTDAKWNGIIEETKKISIAFEWKTKANGDGKNGKYNKTTEWVWKTQKKWQPNNVRQSHFLGWQIQCKLIFRPVSNKSIRLLSFALAACTSVFVSLLLAFVRAPEY